MKLNELAKEVEKVNPKGDTTVLPDEECDPCTTFVRITDKRGSHRLMVDDETGLVSRAYMRHDGHIGATESDYDY